MGRRYGQDDRIPPHGFGNDASSGVGCICKADAETICSQSTQLLGEKNFSQANFDFRLIFAIPGKKGG